jgi:NADH:ubiquinone oxidoreductase subunit 4 (subunit M)
MANIALRAQAALWENFILSRIYKTTIAAVIELLVLCGVYSLWLCNRILFGNLKFHIQSSSRYYLSRIYYYVPLFFFILLWGSIHLFF